MSNSITAFNEAFWAREMQSIFFKENVAIALANTELREQLSAGDTVHKPYRSYLVPQTYSKGTDISTFNDLTATDEYLSVDTAKVVPFYVDDLDKIQNKWDAASQFAQDAMRVLNNVIDQVILAEYSNSRSYIASQDLGGSGTGSIAITQANVANLFAVAARKLEAADVPTNDICAVIGPRIMEILKLYIGGRETTFGDSVSANGLVGNRFGFTIYQSNNIPFSALITYGSTTNNPSNLDTFTLDGITFTFVSSIGSTAGNVLIETNAVDTMANLVNAINNSTSGVGTKWIQLATADRKKLQKNSVTATNSTTTFTITGYGDVGMSESASNFAITSNTQYPLFMKRGAIDLVIQKSPSVEFRVAEKRLGRYVYPWVLYGKKTFDSMKDAMVYAKVDTAAWV